MTYDQLSGIQSMGAAALGGACDMPDLLAQATKLTTIADISNLKHSSNLCASDVPST